MNDKAHRLEQIYRQLRGELSQWEAGQERIPVFGEGDPDSPLMMVGEAPGEQETLQGRPFVGKAGKNLDEFLQIVGLSREEIYITNVVKFRPTKEHPRTHTLSNRPPRKEEITRCLPCLWQEIECVAPRVIVTLGNTPLQAILQGRTVIGTVHGRPWEMGGCGTGTVLFPLYHPASIIYNRSLAEVYHADLQSLRDYLRDRDIFPGVSR